MIRGLAACLDTEERERRARVIRVGAWEGSVGKRLHLKWLVKSLPDNFYSF